MKTWPVARIKEKHRD